MTRIIRTLSEEEAASARSMRRAGETVRDIESALSLRTGTLTWLGREIPLKTQSDDYLATILAATEKHPTKSAAARSLGLSESTFRKHLLRAQHRPAKPVLATSEGVSVEAPAPVAKAIDISQAAAPTTWCDLTREGGWERRAASDKHTSETRVNRHGEEIATEHSEFDPGAVYPADWKGPVYGDIKVARRVFDDVKRAIVFGAQDKTPACGPSMNAMLAFAQFLGIDAIHAGRCTYNRKWYEEIFGGPPRKDVGFTKTVAQYSSAFEGYLTSKPVVLSDRLEFRAEVNISPTARNPLSGLLTYGRGRSTLFAHPRQDLLPVPRHPTEFPINTQTTGYMTTPNYVDRKEGHVARFHHIVGFTIVEIDKEGRHWAEHVDVDMETGEFQWQDIQCDGYGMISTGHSIPAMKCGDIHAEVQHKPAIDATFFAKDSMAAVLRPEMTVVGDIIDFSDFSHHNTKNYWHKHEVMARGSTVAKCLQTVADTMVCIRGAVKALYIDKGNHDLHPHIWLQQTDWRFDPRNAEIHLRGNLEAIRQTRENPDEEPQVFEFLLREMVPDRLVGITFLKRNDVLRAEGVDLHNHGDQASNGAKGSLTGHMKSSRKKATEHTHSPAKREGCCIAGYLGQIDPMPKFARGGDTTWAHANTAIMPRGKMSLIFIHDGKWRAGPRRIANSSKIAA